MRDTCPVPISVSRRSPFSNLSLTPLISDVNALISSVYISSSSGSIRQFQTLTSWKAWSQPTEGQYHRRHTSHYKSPRHQARQETSPNRLRNMGLAGSRNRICVPVWKNRSTSDPGISVEPVGTVSTCAADKSLDFIVFLKKENRQVLAVMAR
jgi:hypothetical protein